MPFPASLPGLFCPGSSRSRGQLRAPPASDSGLSGMLPDPGSPGPLLSLLPVIFLENRTCSSSGRTWNCSCGGKRQGQADPAASKGKIREWEEILPVSWGPVKFQAPNAGKEGKSSGKSFQEEEQGQGRELSRSYPGFLGDANPDFPSSLTPQIPVGSRIPSPVGCAGPKPSP